VSAKKNAFILEFPDNRLPVALGGPHANLGVIYRNAQQACGSSHRI